jgi:hypothetical protein
MNASVTLECGPQHLKALERANEVRLARAALKRRVASGEIRVADVVLACPAEVEGMAISDLLMSQRRWGRTRCRKFLATIPITESKQIGTLTDRQRRAVASDLPIPIPQSRSHAPELTAARAPALAGAAV